MAVTTTVNRQDSVTFRVYRDFLFYDVGTHKNKTQEETKTKPIKKRIFLFTSKINAALETNLQEECGKF